MAGPTQGAESKSGACPSRTIALALAIGAAALLVVPAGCLGPLAAPVPAAHGPEAPPVRGGTLHLASIGDPRTLDPAGPSDGLAMQAQHLLFAGLVDLDDRAEVVPELAERWTVDEDGRGYHFVLRPGVLMHDGAELTADDVKRSAERSLHPASPNPNASYFQDIVGCGAFVSGQADHLAGIVVDGRYAISFHLDAPDAAFLSLLAMHTLRPVCRSAGTRYDDAWLPCGAGPFRLLPGGWQRGSSLRLVRHEGYFRTGLPYLDAVEWTFAVPIT
ncbi:MAG: ABC transporter substrate-binding protein, partial [Myxococcales bacterium]|nr:ABC transporter substrate-binding protein [Myxococcales bacterium]